MGIEVKFIRGIRQGGRISEALDQIIYKYAKYHIKGEELKTICIAVYYMQARKGKGYNPQIVDSIHIFTKGLLTYWGIGYLNLNENPLRIQFGSDNQNDKNSLLIVKRFQILNTSRLYIRFFILLSI